ncbi:flagellar hook-associated protein FlgL [Thalassoroseus pseudoceratinae]|uniref:flagellar hook-associated protein FlgL n=1 Tax=Thalassoroseus pseudoceratinae TaxID=2713176 RepID=UPI0014233909|nr:flagellar hook-associated protein FlgL [Thalassoroseus pseudoceratinae]
MTIGPLLAGRIPNSLVSQRLNQNLQSSQQLLARLQDQAGSGQKFFLPSESPTAAIRTIVFQRTLERHSQYETSVQTSTSFLSASELALQSVSDGLNEAKSILLTGSGNTLSEAERLTLAEDVQSLIRGMVGTANTQFRGRYLFGGSQSESPPFELTDSGAVLYQGDGLAIDSRVDTGMTIANNIDGITAFASLSEPDLIDADPALTLQTAIDSLNGGLGVDLGQVTVTVDDGVNQQTETVDLVGARRIEDVQTRLEAAFATGPITLTVEVDPATSSGLRLTPSSGTVAVSDVTGSAAAAQLGINSTAVAAINGGDLNPRLTMQTELSSLNGGTGIGATVGTGLQLTQGDRTVTVDLSAATTIEDVFNELQKSGLDLVTDIDSTGRGLIVASRVSGVDFSIGENGGQNATLLGLRTLTGTTALAELDGGLGVPVDDGIPLRIQRRDGTEVEVDLAGTKTVQQVLDAINAVDPGVLVASLNAVGNGITLTDDDGVSTGPLIVEDNAVSSALGIAGQENGTNPAIPLIGTDQNPQEPPGVLGILVRLEEALRTGDQRELNRLQPLFNDEADRFNALRGEVGADLKVLETVANRLADREVQIQSDLSQEFDADLTEIITQTNNIQIALDATLRIAAQTSQLTLLSYL